jgi:hypothetical protein
LALLICSPVYSLAAPPQHPPEQVKGILFIERFTDKNLTQEPEWWVFDNVQLSVTKDGRLSVKGKAADWYVGGMGTYLAQEGRDLSKYNSLEMDVWGNGVNSGAIKIELYDDDNGNMQIEQDPQKSYAPLYDDRLAYEIKVDWKGLKHISIPLSEFEDNNPEAGDNIWNPQQSKGSGGLLQMQFIFVATSKTGKVDLLLDNLGFKEAKK